MAHRNVVREDFVGKTVVGINCRAVNMLQFEFSDGSRVALEASTVTEARIPAIQACEDCVDSAEEFDESPPTAKPPLVSTFVDVNALYRAINTWRGWQTNKLTDLVSDTQDLYLKLVAIATELPYDEVLVRFGRGDRGILDARRAVKRSIWGRMLRDPASILPQEVREETPVQSKA